MQFPVTKEEARKAVRTATTVMVYTQIFSEDSIWVPITKKLMFGLIDESYDGQGLAYSWSESGTEMLVMDLGEFVIAE